MKNTFQTKIIIIIIIFELPIATAVITPSLTNWLDSEVQEILLKQRLEHINSHKSENDIDIIDMIL